LEIHVKDLVEVFVFMAAMFVLPNVLMWLADFCTDPEQALERLGGLVAAFRRGLAGKPAGRVENPELASADRERP
jgi:hypothetical protein